jgi:hypothetical protein
MKTSLLQQAGYRSFNKTEDGDGFVSITPLTTEKGEDAFRRYKAYLQQFSKNYQDVRVLDKLHNSLDTSSVFKQTNIDDFFN